LLHTGPAKVVDMTITATAPGVTARTPLTVRRWSPWRSPAGQPPWARPALLALTVITAAVYGWGLRLEQLHNFYLPAVKSMSVSWRAWLYGGYDPAASITLDKLPGAFQVQALSARIFGFSSWSVLLPQVIEAAVAILVLYGTVRRWLGVGAGLLAAAAFATMPILAALSHSQIADTLLTLLLVLAAYAWQRALTDGGLRWLLLCGVWVGLAFQAKMVQAWGVLPAFALVYLLAGPGRLVRRLAHLGLAGLVTFAVSMWWIALVLLTPAGARPYIDGSTDNSPISMVFDYNLFSRYASGGDTGGLGIPGFSGSGWSYMVSDGIAPQVGWLYPLAAAGLVAGVWWQGRAPRTDPVRAGFLMWALWFAVHAVAFSTGRVAHSFYVVAVAPAVASLAAGGLILGWRAYRRGGRRRWMLPVAVAATVAWGLYLSSRFATFLPWLRPTMAVLGVVAVGLLAAVPVIRRRRRRRHLGARLALAGGALSVAAVLLAPAAWAASTGEQRYSGSGIGPAAGPMEGFGPGGRGGRPGGIPGGNAFRGEPPPGGFAEREFPGGGVPGGPGGTGAPGGPEAGGPGGPGGPGGGGPGGFAIGGPGGMQTGTRPSTAATQLVSYLRAHQPGRKYLLAVQGSNEAGPLILAGASVLPIGGFSGQVPSTTPDQLAALVTDGALRYVMAGRTGGGRGFGMPTDAGGNASAITTWVTDHCAAITDSAVPTSGVYDCAPA
jgi:4-amino-4-deoxy-L-arabinose transferase-like glycosyltransferase